MAPKLSPRERKAKRKIAQALKHVTPEKAQEILENAEEEEDKRIDDIANAGEPGTVINGEKVPLTYKYMVDHPDRFGPVVSFIPERTVPILINGVRVQCLAGVEMHVPKAFKDIYDRSGREMAQNLGRNLKDAGYDTIIQPGAGALEPELTVSK